MALELVKPNRITKILRGKKLRSTTPGRGKIEITKAQVIKYVCISVDLVNGRSRGRNERIAGR